MSDFNRGFAPATAAADMSVDAGLRKFMLGVYNKLALGLVLSAALAFLTSGYSPITDIFYRVQDGRLVGMTAAGVALQWAPLVALFGSMFVMRNPSVRSSGILYWLVVALIGAGSGVWMLIYTGGSVAVAFLSAAIAFGSVSLYGYATKRNLSGMGNFLMMAVIGLLVAMVLSMFFPAPGLALIINLLGVLIFAGLTAYDTQRLKMTYYALGGDQAGMAVATNYGALSLYINFINMFQFLLSLTGQRR